MCHLLYTRVAHFAILTLVDLLFRTVPLFCSSDLSGFNGISVKASLINNMSNNRMLVFATSLKIHQIEWQLPTDQTKWKIKQKYKLGKMEKIRLDMGEKLCDIIDMGEKNYAFIWTEIKRPLFDDKKNFVFNCFDSNSRNALSIREKWGNSIRLIKLKNLSLKRSITVYVCVCQLSNGILFRYCFPFASFRFIHYVCLHESVDIHYILVTQFRISNASLHLRHLCPSVPSTRSVNTDWATAIAVVATLRIVETQIYHFTTRNP